jgi:4-hydroxybenzoate polyprenyltransferase
MARASEKAPLLNSSPAEEKLPFPLGLVSPGVRPYLELIRFHKVGNLSMVPLLRSGLTFST